MEDKSSDLEQMSRDASRVDIGRLLVAFERFERAGSMRGEWKTPQNDRRAKHYSEQGRKKLSNEIQEFDKRVAGIARVLGAL